MIKQCVLNNQIKIVDNFLNEYYRSPTKKEFKCLGGDLKYVKRVYGSYIKFLDHYGYDAPTKAKCVQVFDDRGKLVFEGSTNDVSLKFNAHITVIRGACNGRVKLLKNKYKCKYKE